jgi:hypothetical protein
MKEKNKMKWWLEKPMRLIQTNLREIDADLDAEQYVNSLKEYHANVVICNTGGIIANYPTNLAYHYQNPYLKDDLIGKLIAKVHQAGIRFIARFDFSKVNETIALNYPEWRYIGVDGNAVNYNGQVHVCVNSLYQQEYSLGILAEVIDRYPIDAVFFNMIGYRTGDYSGNYHGICQCNGCRRRFRKMYGHELPLAEDSNDPVYRSYVQFTDLTSRELYARIADFIKSRHPDIAICNYTHQGTDIYRIESNSAIDRALPEWNYSATGNVRVVNASWDNMAVSNTVVHFVDLAYRHSAVAPLLTAQRIAQNITNCGWPDLCLIGHLNNQDDRTCLPIVKNLFRFHFENEHYYTDVKPVADIGLILPEGSSYFGSMQEYKGIFRMLAQTHYLFDVLHDSVLDAADAAIRLGKYKMLVLPDTRNISTAAAAVVDLYTRAGGLVLVTGGTSMGDLEENPVKGPRLNCLGIEKVIGILKKEKGTYFKVRNIDKQLIHGFDQTDLIYLNDFVLDVVPVKKARSFLSYIPPCMFGPPEKCYYTEETNKPGLILNSFGAGQCVFIPWNIGKHYEKMGNPAHLLLMKHAIDDLLALSSSISLNAPGQVEVSSQLHIEKRWQLVNFVNLSGQLGTAFLEKIPIFNLGVRIKVPEKPQNITSLMTRKELNWTCKNQAEVVFTLPELRLLDTIVIEF